jgi:hypothetical protein
MPGQGCDGDSGESGAAPAQPKKVQEISTDSSMAAPNSSFDVFRGILHRIFEMVASFAP